VSPASTKTGTRTRLSRAERQDRTRTQLLDAAERAFLTRGYFATSIDEVAERAGFSKGAVYSNFPNKDALLLAVVERESERRLTSISAAAFSAGADIDHQIDEAARAFTALLDREWEWQALYLECLAAAARNPELRRRLGEGNRRVREVAARSIEQQPDAAHYTLAPDVIAAATFAMGTGVAYERLADPDLPDDLFAVLLHAFMAGITRTPGRD
jgi:AcrR family transcriptional regulator